MSAKPPIAVIVGGINGAGKTTVAEMLARRRRLANATFLNPDKVAAALAIQSRLTKAVSEVAAMRYISRELRRLMMDRQDFVAETVLANVAYRRIATEAKIRGYFVRLLFIGLPTVEDAIDRVARRVSKGGHDVAEADIGDLFILLKSDLFVFIVRLPLCIFRKQDAGLRRDAKKFRDYGVNPSSLNRARVNSRKIVGKLDIIHGGIYRPI